MVRNLVKKSQKSGQATVEYILLIVIVMAIALAVKGPLGDRLGKFSGSIVGSDGYYACLMERGYLPEDPRTSECAQHKDLATATLKEGSAGGSDAEGSRGKEAGSSGSGDSLSSSPGGSEGDSSSESEGSGGIEGSSGTEDLGGVSDQSASPKRHLARRGSGSSGEGSVDTSPASFEPGWVSKGQLEEDSEESDDGNSRSKSRAQSTGSGFNNSKAGYKKSRFRAGSSGAEGYLGERIYDEESPNKEVFKVEEIATGTAGSETQGDSNKTKWMNEAQKKGEESKDKPKRWNFLAFIKYFLIAALIILLLAIIFSQVMEYQSRD